MKRRLWCGTIVGLMWFGIQGLPAQNPTSAVVPAVVPAAAFPREGDQLTFRTAGQPERRVRVLRIVGTVEDGLADVQDVSSKANYSIPLKILVQMAKSASATAPGSVSAAGPTIPPLVVTPIPNAQANGWPKPTSPSLPLRDAAIVRSNGLRSPLPTPTAARALMQDTLPVAFAPPTQPPAPAALPIPQPPVPTTVPPNVASADPPSPTVSDDVFFRPAAAQAIAPPALPEGWTKPTPIAVQTPTPIGLPPTQPSYSTVMPPTTVIAAPGYVTVPVYDFGALPPVPTVVAAPEATASVTVPTTVPPVPPRLAPPTVIVQTSSASQRTPSIGIELIPAEVLAGFPAAMAEELQPYLTDLSRALRPSVRERAAGGLADGRYGSRPEVKAVLARAALLDPASNVRAHCIRLLSKLGYHESSYLDYLDACSESADALVKQAAVDAVAKLRVR